MKLFKTQDNKIFAYELDGSQDHLIGDKIPITQEEANAIIANRPVIEISLSQLQIENLKARLPAEENN
jgi:hypothetical protein